MLITTFCCMHLAALCSKTKECFLLMNNVFIYNRKNLVFVKKRILIKVFTLYVLICHIHSSTQGGYQRDLLTYFYQQCKNFWTCENFVLLFSMLLSSTHFRSLQKTEIWIMQVYCTQTKSGFLMYCQYLTIFECWPYSDAVISNVMEGCSA